jgi:hypothetical protein
MVAWKVDQYKPLSSEALTISSVTRLGCDMYANDGVLTFAMKNNHMLQN